MKPSTFSLFTVAAALCATTLTPATVAAAEGPIRNTDSPNRIPGQYIVVFKNTTQMRQTGVPTLARNLTTRHQGTLRGTFSRTIPGFATQMTETQARRLAANPDVAYVEQDVAATLNGTQTNPPSWGLDRIDQRDLPLNNTYNWPNAANNVRAYVIDSGIRASHSDFGNRASSGFDASNSSSAGTLDTTDCTGHGTHVAGIIGGTQHGVAKGVRLVAVRYKDCGQGYKSGAIAAVEWVTRNAIKPAVANISLGFPRSGTGSDALGDAVAASIASGITYVVAAGNNRGDACNLSPAYVPAAITVGAIAQDNRRWIGSPDFGTNHGPCVDINAPGKDILSAGYLNDTHTRWQSGTSMSAPHVAGAAALVLAGHPSYTPAQVDAEIKQQSTPNLMVNIPLNANPPTTTRLLHVPASWTGLCLFTNGCPTIP